MRRVLAMTLVALVTAGTATAQGEIEQLSWLAGCWKNAGAEPGSGEHWTTLAGGLMLGTGRTVRKGKPAEFEFMQLRTVENGKLAFIGQPSGSPPTVFPLKTIDDNGAVFENPGHDFPQRVIYRRTATGDLSARIEGTVDGKLEGIDYPMKRVDCTEYFRQP